MLKSQLVILVLITVLLGCTEPSAQSPVKAQAAPKSPVELTTVSTELITPQLVLPGRVSPFRQSNVRPQVNGVITERLFTEGAYVKKGQQLYNIDDKLFRVALQSAKADVIAAQANVKALKAKQERYADLLATNAISAQDYDDIVAQVEQAEAAVSVAQAQVAAAQVNLDYSKVYAPISGRISRSFFTEGALVTANQSASLATITQLDPIYVDVQVPSDQVLNMQLAMQKQGSLNVEVTLSGSGASMGAIRGEVEFSEVIVEESTGSVTLRARLPNPQQLLLPGLFVNTTIYMGEFAGLSIPQRAVARKPTGTLQVWVVNEAGEAYPRDIVVGQAMGNKWQVVSGLRSGEQVVVAGYHKLQPGKMVKPVSQDAVANTSSDN